MEYEFRLPDLGEGVAEGEVVRWFVHEGDTIREDAALVSVLTDKANVEIPSPKTGKVLKIHAQEGEKVKVGAALVTIEVTGAAPSAGAAAATAPPAAPPGPGPVASAPPPSPPSPPAAPGSSRYLAAPYIRRLAAERGIDLVTVTGTGPGGRILENDLAPSAAKRSAPPVPPSAPPAASVPVGEKPPAVPPLADEDVLERVPVRGLRRVIAEHMTESRHKAAHYTYVEEIDVSDLVQLRDRMAKHVEKKGLRLSFLPFVVKGVVAGLRAYPRVNARFDDERQELVVHKSYNIGIATATPDGLLVPVVHHADRKSVTDIARTIQELAEKGREGKLSRAEMSGGTFTITSLGALGGLLATPILNYPEVAILGVHRIIRRPVYRADGTVGPADLMNLSISLDHRVLDGIIGAQFIAVVKSYLKDPHQLFAELA
ncbi:MAG TPA: dihydrolipoamide acetyltransferase family protein [Thermoplasmata archaeon]|nr:dihydrolipoamide acetyltransferase family protein [Thermoplasmata archaeon]